MAFEKAKEIGFFETWKQISITDFFYAIYIIMLCTAKGSYIALMWIYNFFVRLGKNMMKKSEKMEKEYGSKRYI